MKGYPKWFSKTFIKVVCSTSLLSGILLLPTVLDLRLEWNVWWKLEAGHRLWVVALHVAFGFLLIGVIGALGAIHMPKGWRRQLKRVSGSLLVAMNAFLTVTGVGILYLGHENWSVISSYSHSLVGILLAPLYLFHFSSLSLPTHR